MLLFVRWPAGCMRKGVRHAALKTVLRLFDRAENSKETIDSREFQVEQDGRRYRRKAYVSIPFDRSFQAAEQQMQSLLVHLL